MGSVEFESTKSPLALRQDQSNFVCMYTWPTTAAAFLSHRGMEMGIQVLQALQKGTVGAGDHGSLYMHGDRCPIMTRRPSIMPYWAGLRWKENPHR